jgi:hypothetical protein
MNTGRMLKMNSSKLIMILFINIPIIDGVALNSWSLGQILLSVSYIITKGLALIA